MRLPVAVRLAIVTEIEAMKALPQWRAFLSTGPCRLEQEKPVGRQFNMSACGGKLLLESQTLLRDRQSRFSFDQTGDASTLSP